MLTPTDPSRFPLQASTQQANHPAKHINADDSKPVFKDFVVGQCLFSSGRAGGRPGRTRLNAH